MSLLDSVVSHGEPYLAATSAIVIMVMLSGIAIGMGKAFSNKKILMWGQEELLQAAINSALLGALFILVTTTNTAMTSLVPANDLTCTAYDTTTAIGFGQCYLYTLYLNVTYVANSLLMANSIISFLSHLSFNLGFAGNSIGFTLFSFLSTIEQTLSAVLEMLYFFMFSTYIQIDLLYAIDALMLSTFLPLGLILRCFFMTRRLGAVLMAIAIGAYVVYPLAFVLNYELLTQLNGHINESKTQLDIFLGKFSYVTSINVSDSGTLQSLASSLNLSGFYDAAQSLARTLTIMQSDLVLQTLVLPTLDILITFVAIRELAGILGSEITFRGFGFI